MLQTNSHDIEDLFPDSASIIEYHKIEEDDLWKAEMIDHIIESMDDTALDDEDKLWIEYLCTD